MRRSLQRFKASLITFRKAAPPVVIMALRRGGSTMLADAIAGNRGVWYANEPYAMFPGRLGMPRKAERLFVPPHSHFFDLEGAELETFTSFSKSLLNCEFKDMGRVRNALPVLRAERVCLKVLNAPWMMDWFLKETDAQIVTLLRHPGDQALSVIKNGWQFPVAAYLERPGFMEKTFTPGQAATARRVFEGGNTWQIAILDWIISSHPLRMASDSRVRAVRYEDIVRAPDSFVEEVLVGALGLEALGAMKASFKRPSGSSSMSTEKTNAAIATGKVDALLERWRTKVSVEDARAAQALMEAFEVQDYSFV